MFKVAQIEKSKLNILFLLVILLSLVGIAGFAEKADIPACRQIGKIYEEYARTLGHSYWIGKGNQQLQEYSGKFTKSLLDPLNWMKETAAEAVGAGYYGSAGEAVKQLITFRGTITFYQIGTIENQAWTKVNLSDNERGLKPKEELNKIVNEMCKNPQKALDHISRLLPLIKNWKDKVGETKEEISNLYEYTNWRYTRKEKGKTIIVSSPDKNDVKTIKIDLSNFETIYEGTDFKDPLKIRVIDKSYWPWEKGKWEITVRGENKEEDLTCKPGLSATGTYYCRKEIYFYKSLNPEISVKFKVTKPSNDKVIFKAYVKGMYEKEKFENPLYKIASQYSQKKNKKSCNLATNHLQSVISFLEAEKIRLERDQQKIENVSDFETGTSEGWIARETTKEIKHRKAMAGRRSWEVLQSKKLGGAHLLKVYTVGDPPANLALNEEFKVDMASDFTLNFDYYLPESNNRGPFIIACKEEAYNDSPISLSDLRIIFGIRHDPVDGPPQVRQIDRNGEQPWFKIKSPPFYQKHQVKISKKGQKLTSYLDGKQVATTTIPLSGKWVLGLSGSGGWGSPRIIYFDNVRLYRSYANK